MISYRLVDIGANLAHPAFKKDLGAVIERARQAGLCKIMITGTSLKSTREARDLCEKYPGFFYFTSGQSLMPNPITSFQVFIRTMQRNGMKMCARASLHWPIIQCALLSESVGSTLIAISRHRISNEKFSKSRWGFLFDSIVLDFRSKSRVI
jgi:hypothetical protein